MFGVEGKTLLPCQSETLHCFVVLSNNIETPVDRKDLHNIFRRQLGFSAMSPPDMSKWTHLARAVDEVVTPVRIAIVGKYTGLQDSYLSVIKASDSRQRLGFILVLAWVWVLAGSCTIVIPSERPGLSTHLY